MGSASVYGADAVAESTAPMRGAESAGAPRAAFMAAGLDSSFANGSGTSGSSTRIALRRRRQGGAPSSDPTPAFGYPAPRSGGAHAWGSAAASTGTSASRFA